MQYIMRYKEMNNDKWNKHEFYVQYLKLNENVPCNRLKITKEVDYTTLIDRVFELFGLRDRSRCPFIFQTSIWPISINKPWYYARDFFLVLYIASLPLVEANTSRWRPHSSSTRGYRISIPACSAALVRVCIPFNKMVVAHDAKTTTGLWYDASFRIRVISVI